MEEAGAAGGDASQNGANGGGLGRRAISYDKFATMMQSSFRRRFNAGETIFRRGDKARTRRDISPRSRINALKVCYHVILRRSPGSTLSRRALAFGVETMKK